MTKYVWVLVLGFVGALPTAHAVEDQLLCRHYYYKDWNKPLIEAKIGRGEVLRDVKMNFNKYWDVYALNESFTYAGQRVVRGSAVYEPSGELEPQALTNNRSPYNQGRHKDLNNEYTFRIGNWSSKAGNKKAVEGDYMARLILPKDLGSKYLSQYQIRDDGKHPNANSVLIVPPPKFGGQYGDNFYWLECKSQ
jgi:hypothetical protein